MSKTANMLKGATSKEKYRYMIQYMELRSEILEQQIPTAKTKEKSHYWWIQRKTRRTKKNPDGWLVVRDIMATKSEIAEIFVKHFRDGRHRIKHLLTY